MSEANKELVLRWFGLGLSTAPALELVHDDVVWHLAPALATLLQGDPGGARGHDGLRWVTRMSDAVYAELPELQRAVHPSPGWRRR